ncbi:hypothetical protein ZWY2020_035998 [Hordeum vulgare]|nr:hypothetical protein ZWY2020_035998 [Hordeum vulgare]
MASRPGYGWRLPGSGRRPGTRTAGEEGGRPGTGTGAAGSRHRRSKMSDPSEPSKEDGLSQLLDLRSLGTIGLLICMSGGVLYQQSTTKTKAPNVEPKKENDEEEQKLLEMQQGCEISSTEEHSS